MNNKFLIKKPLVTEKTTALSKYGKYVFQVEKNATVAEAKKAVELIYGIHVVSTNVINVKSKTRRLGQSIGVKPGYKKIIMTLKKGEKMDVVPQ